MLYGIEGILNGKLFGNGEGGSSGGVTLPALTNPAGADQILEGYEAVDGSGKKLTGTHVCESGGGGEWMNFCADGATWTGESLSFSMTAIQKYTDKVILSPIGQYRFTVDGVAYMATDADITKGITPNGCPLRLSASKGTYTLSDMITETNVTRTVKVESWTGTTEYAP